MFPIEFYHLNKIYKIMDNHGLDENITVYFKKNKMIMKKFAYTKVDVGFSVSIIKELIKLFEWESAYKIKLQFDAEEIDLKEIDLEGQYIIEYGYSKNIKIIIEWSN